MEAFQDFEETVTCPYDKAHSIRKSKLSVHLVKCAKNFPDAEMVVCDFNASHRVARPLLRYHHENCPDRRKIETKIIQQNDEDPSKIYPIRQVHVEVEEYWDDEDHPSYDPAAYCEQNNVLRHMDVQSASKRRNFRLEERERLNRFREPGNPRPDVDDSLRPSPVCVQVADSARRTTETNTSKQVPRRNEPISAVSIEEDATHLSLIDRIKKGNKKTYEPKN